MGGDVHTKTHRVVGAALSSVVVALAGCDVSDASHVVKRTTPASTVASTAASSETTGSPGAPSPIRAAPSSPAVPGATGTSTSGIDDQTLNQMASELGAMDNSLDKASSNLNNPQGDN
jgi:hypothetical protein